MVAWLVTDLPAARTVDVDSMPVVLPLLLAARLRRAGGMTVPWSEGGFLAGRSERRSSRIHGTTGGWAHYLAFDLFIGGWEVRDAQRHGIPHLLVVPALVLTFLFGPAGWLLYMGIRRFNARSTNRG